MAEFNNFGRATVDTSGVEGATASISELGDAVERTWEQIKQSILSPRMTEGFAKLKKEAADLNSELERVNKTLSEAGQGTDPILLTEMQKQAGQLEKQLISVNKEIARMEAKGGGEAYTRTFSEIEEAVKHFPRIIQEMNAGLATSSNVEKDLTEIQRLEAEYERLKKIKETVDKANEKTANEADKSADQHTAKPTDQRAEAAADTSAAITEENKKIEEAIQEREQLSPELQEINEQLEYLESVKASNMRRLEDAQTSGSRSAIAMETARLASTQTQIDALKEQWEKLGGSKGETKQPEPPKPPEEPKNEEPPINNEPLDEAVREREALVEKIQDLNDQLDWYNNIKTQTETRIAQAEEAGRTSTVEAESQRLESVQAQIDKLNAELERVESLRNPSASGPEPTPTPEPTVDTASSSAALAEMQEILQNEQDVLASIGEVQNQINTLNGDWDSAQANMERSMDAGKESDAEMYANRVAEIQAQIDAKEAELQALDARLQDASSRQLSFSQEDKYALSPEDQKALSETYELAQGISGMGGAPEVDLSSYQEAKDFAEDLRNTLELLNAQAADVKLDIDTAGANEHTQELEGRLQSLTQFANTTADALQLVEQAISDFESSQVAFKDADKFKPVSDDVMALASTTRVAGAPTVTAENYDTTIQQVKELEAAFQELDAQRQAMFAQIQAEGNVDSVGLLKEQLEDTDDKARRVYDAFNLIRESLNEFSDSQIGFSQQSKFGGYDQKLAETGVGDFVRSKQAEMAGGGIKLIDDAELEKAQKAQEVLPGIIQYLQEYQNAINADVSAAGGGDNTLFLRQEADRIAQEKQALEQTLSALGESVTSYIDSHMPTIVKLRAEIEEAKENLRVYRETANTTSDKDVFTQQIENIKEEEARLKQLEAQLKAVDPTYGKPEKPTKEPKEPNKAEPAKPAPSGPSPADEEKKKTQGLLSVMAQAISLRTQLFNARMKLPFASDVPQVASDIKKLQTQLWSLNYIFGQLKDSPFARILSGSVNLLVSGLRTAIQVSGQLLAKLGSAAWNGVKAGATAALSAVRTLATRGFEALKATANAAFNSIKTGANVTLSAFKGVVSILGKMGGLLGQIGKVGFGAIKKGAQSFVGRMKQIGQSMTQFTKRHTPNMMKALNGIRSMLMRRVKRMFISSIFNQVKAGLQSLAKQSKEFNASMTAITNGSKQLAGNLSVAFGNIVNAVAPVLTTILGYINQLLTAFNALWAALTGKKTMTVAAKSTDKYGKSLGGASKKAKELKRELYGFDELTKQQDDDDNSGSGSGIKYKEVPVDKMMSDWMLKVKDAINNQDWEGLGALIAEKLNGVLAKIDKWFKDLRPKVVKWAKNIARILNGFTSAFNWTLLGQTIGDGLNLAFDAVNTFLKTYNWKELGKGFAKALTGLFNTVDWKLVGETFANGFNAIFRTIAGFVKNAKWKTYGKKLGQAVNSFFKNIDWKSVNEAVTGGINGLIELFTGFIDEVDWEKIGTDIFTNLSTMIAGINWKGLGELLSKSLNTLITLFGALVDSDVITNLGEGIGTALGTALNGIDYKKLALKIRIGMTKLALAFRSIIKGIDFPNLAKKISEGINTFFDTENGGKAWDEATTALSESVNEIIAGFAALVGPDGIDFVGIGNTIGTQAGKLLSEIDWDTLVSSVAIGVLKIASGFWRLVSSINIPNIAKQLATALNGLITNKEVQEAFDQNVKETTTALNSIIEAFAALVGEDGIDFEGIAKMIGEKANALLTGIDWETLVLSILVGGAKLASAFLTMVNQINLSGIASKIVAGINGFFTSEDGTNAWDSLVESALGFIQNLADAFGTIVDELKLDAIRQKISSAINKLISTRVIGRVLGKVGTFVTNLASEFAKLVSEIDFTTLAKDIGAGINSLFSDKGDGNGAKLTGIASSVSTSINNIKDAFKELIEGENKIDFAKIRKSLTDGISTLLYDTDWAGLIKVIGDGVKLATDEFFKLVTGVFTAPEGEEGLGAKLANGINELFKSDNGEVDLTYFTNLGKNIGDAINAIFTDVNTFLSTVDWDGIGRALGEAVAGIDWAGLASQIISFLWNAVLGAAQLTGGLLGRVVSAIFGVTPVAAFDGAASAWAVAASDSLAKAFSAGNNQQKILAAAAGWASGLNDTVLSQFQINEEAAQNIANTFATGIKTAIESDNPFWIQQSMGKYGYLIPDALAEAIYNNKDLANKSVEELVAGLSTVSSVEGFLAYWESLGVEINDETRAWFTELKNDPEIDIDKILDEAFSIKTTDVGAKLMAELQRAANLDEVKSAFANAGIEVTNEFASAIGGTGTENIAAALQLMALGVDQATIAALDTTNLSANLSEWTQNAGGDVTKAALALMAASGKDVSAIAKQLGYDVGTDLGGIIPESVAKALEEGKTEVANAKAEVAASGTVSETEKATMGKSGSDAGAGVASGTATAMTEGKEAVSTASQGVADAITEKLDTLPANEKKQAEAMMQYVVDAIVEGDPLATKAIETAANNIVAKAEEILSGTKGLEIAKTFIGGIGSGITQKAMTDADSAQSRMQSASNSVSNAASAGLSYAKGHSIGYRFMQGWYDGSNKWGQTIVNYVTSVCQAIIDTANSAFDIHSPSRVAEQIGSFFMQGMTIGLEEDGANAISTVGDIAKAISEEGVPTATDALGAGLDGTIDKLTRIAEIFDGIADTIANMGGFEIPAVASGRVIPYRSRVDTKETENPQQSATDIENAVYAAMRRVFTDEDTTQNINIFLDGRKLSDAISKQQRQKQRAMGVS